MDAGSPHSLSEGVATSQRVLTFRWKGRSLALDRPRTSSAKKEPIHSDPNWKEAPKAGRVTNRRVVYVRSSRFQSHDKPLSQSQAQP